ncbi:hypothetical protein DH2020_005467 [Rehmannia glutinosa]|uniref:Retrotransposon Copia-like N-terminal domain-containing protein n=1 Tax=Rehmannia glutinosa TaxID=99300 RepID=A0ABR0XGQ8_REHGL
MEDPKTPGSGPQIINPQSVQSPTIQPQNQVVTVKLTDNNYLLWKMQILTCVRGCGLLGFLTGKIQPPEKFLINTETQEAKSNREYEIYLRQDQLLASWILSTLSKSILVLAVGLDSASEIWNFLETNFSSHSKARLMEYKFQLQNLKKRSMSMRDYLNKPKACCDALASARNKLSEEDQVLHVLSGLPSEYNRINVTITSAIDFFSMSEASALLTSFESRLDLVVVHIRIHLRVNALCYPLNVKLGGRVDFKEIFKIVDNDFKMPLLLCQNKSLRGSTSIPEWYYVPGARSPGHGRASNFGLLMQATNFCSSVSNSFPPDM